MAKYLVAGVPVSDASFEHVLAWLLDAPLRRDRLSTHFATAQTIVEAAHRPALRKALAAADLVAPDGMPLVWVGRLQGRRAMRVCGPDLMPALIDRGRAQDARHYFYGGGPGVPERLADVFAARFPGLQVVGTYSPPFRDLTTAEIDAVVERINAARPEYVWVGLGTPKQDLWIAEHRDRLDAAVLLAVGAAFNIHAGLLRRAPRWMQRLGLEWLLRLASEPQRLWRRYTLGNLEFIGLVLVDMLRGFARSRYAKRDSDGHVQRTGE